MSHHSHGFVETFGNRAAHWLANRLFPEPQDPPFVPQISPPRDPSPVVMAAIHALGMVAMEYVRTRAVPHEAWMQPPPASDPPAPPASAPVEPAQPKPRRRKPDVPPPEQRDLLPAED